MALEVIEKKISFNSINCELAIENILFLIEKKAIEDPNLREIIKIYPFSVINEEILYFCGQLKDKKEISKAISSVLKNNSAKYIHILDNNLSSLKLVLSKNPENCISFSASYLKKNSNIFEKFIDDIFSELIR